MKFCIDEDVDAEVRHALVNAGHDAWIVTQAGRSGADDGDQVAYAHRRRAVYVTHDSELASSRAEMPMTQIVRLKCDEMVAAEVIVQALPVLIPILRSNPYIVMTISRHASGELNFKPKFGTEGKAKRKREAASRRKPAAGN